MARPKNPNAKPRKPREPKLFNLQSALNNALASIADARGGLLTIGSVDEARGALSALADINAEVKSLKILAEFVRERFESEAELKRQLAEMKPATRTKSLPPIQQQAAE